MGCFNVTCCVTRTPIKMGEKCRAIIFKNPDREILTEGQTISLSYLLSDSFQTIVEGIYDEYGGLKGFKDIDWNEDVGIYFISEEAWKEGEKLVQSAYNKSFVDYCVGSGSLGKMAERLSELLEKLKSVMDAEQRKEIDKQTKIDHDSDKVLKYKDELKVVVTLFCFCQANHINMLEPSYGNHYAGQMYNVDLKEKWMKIRQIRIDKLKIEDSEE